MAAQPIPMTYYYALSGTTSEPTKDVLKEVYKKGNDRLKAEYYRYKRKIDYDQFLQNEWHRTDLIRDDLFRAYTTYKYLMELAGFTPNLTFVDISNTEFSNTPNLITIEDTNRSYELKINNVIATETITLPYGQNVATLLSLDTSTVVHRDVYSGPLHGFDEIRLTIFDELQFNKKEPLYSRIVQIERKTVLDPIIGTVGETQVFKPFVAGGKWKVIQDLPDTSTPFSVTQTPTPVTPTPSPIVSDESESETTEEESGSEFEPPPKTTTFPQYDKLEKVFLFFEDNKAVSHWYTYSVYLSQEYLGNFILLDKPQNLILSNDLMSVNRESLKRSFIVVFSAQLTEQTKILAQTYRAKLAPNSNLSGGASNLFFATIDTSDIHIKYLDQSFQSCSANFDLISHAQQNKIIRNAEDFHFSINYIKPNKTIYLDWVKIGTVEDMTELFDLVKQTLLTFPDINLRFLIKKMVGYHIS